MEVEAVINRQPQVRMSLVRPRRSSITGSIVVADVVLKSGGDGAAAHETQIRADILKLCRDALPRHKIPAAISVVPNLAVAATGKLVRSHG
jgi:acyl-coenzyme A synthetase/AMP-(fatty) acid ligase